MRCAFDYPLKNLVHKSTILFQSMKRLQYIVVKDKTYNMLMIAMYCNQGQSLNMTNG